MLSPQTDPRTAQVLQFFETLSPESVRLLPAIYTERARFKDPFNEVTGVAGIHRVFTHMFETTNTPRFIVRSAMTQGDEAWLTWDFLIKRQQGELIIHGASHLHYAPDGRIQQHRDYWDPAEELYAHIPVLGTLVRWLTKRLSATA